MLCRPLIDMKISTSLLSGYDTYYETYVKNSITYYIQFKVLIYNGINPAYLDLTRFYEWAQFCDELVPNSVGSPNTTLSSATALGAVTINVVSTTGFPTSGSGWIVENTGIDAISWTGKTSNTLTGCSGIGAHTTGTVYFADGTEKRCEFNGVIDAESRLWEATNKVAQVGRGTLLMDGTQYSVAVDKRTDATQLFTVGNIGTDSFELSYLSMDDRANSIEVQFSNKNKDYEGDLILVDNPDANTVQNKVSIRIEGITSKTQAIRESYYRMNLNRTLIRSITFDADIDAIACTIGDVIIVQHDIPEWGFGGRIVSATSTTVTLDKSIALTISQAYSILVRLSSTDALIEKSIVNPNDGLEHSVFTISSAWTTIPSKYDIYSTGKTITYKAPYRVTGISKKADMKATINAVEYVDAVYDGDFAIVYSESHAELTYSPVIYTVYDPVYELV